MPQYGGEGAGATEIVFQRFANGTSTINVEPFDKVVDAATKAGIKLIVALTNNWADYGGMDVYTVNLGGKYHDDVSRFLYGNDGHPTDFYSSTVSPRSRNITSDTSRKWSRDTRTLLQSWPGS